MEVGRPRPARAHGRSLHAGLDYPASIDRKSRRGSTVGPHHPALPVQRELSPSWVFRRQGTHEAVRQLRPRADREGQPSAKGYDIS